MGRDSTGRHNVSEAALRRIMDEAADRAVEAYERHDESCRQRVDQIRADVSRLEGSLKAIHDRDVGQARFEGEVNSTLESLSREIEKNGNRQERAFEKLFDQVGKMAEKVSKSEERFENLDSQIGRVRDETKMKAGKMGGTIGGLAGAVVTGLVELFKIVFR